VRDQDFHRLEPGRDSFVVLVAMVVLVFIIQVMMLFFGEALDQGWVIAIPIKIADRFCRTSRGRSAFFSSAPSAAPATPAARTFFLVDIPFHFSRLIEFSLIERGLVEEGLDLFLGTVVIRFCVVRLFEMRFGAGSAFASAPASPSPPPATPLAPLFASFLSGRPLEARAAVGSFSPFGPLTAFTSFA
jgi:hypothetical protein